jgi:hypothetical protein
MDLWTLSDLCTPWCIHVVATLRIAEHIAGGMTDIAALATAAGVDRDALCRVLRHLVSKGVFEQPERGRFALNDLSRQLLAPPVRLGLDLDGFGGRMAYPWSTLLAAVRTGHPSYHTVFGRPFWEDLAAHPGISAQFDDLMGVAGHGVPDPDVLVNPADWADIHTVVDVGGGTGSLLAEILKKRPAIRGTLLDLPQTIARSAETFEAAGVAERVTTVGQSFFDALPAGADLYILRKVLSDWPDPEASAILKRCADAARPNGRIVTFCVAAADKDPPPDLLMLVLVGGRSRTLDEFREMARGAGLEVSAVGTQAAGHAIVECRPT